MSRPLVSAIVPVYNRERYLGDALDSIFAQDYRPLEVIVVNDGSTDGTDLVARSYANVRCLWQPHQGVSAARNMGVAASQGEFLAFLDSDDQWTPTKLRSQIDCLLQNPEIDYCLALMQNVLEPGCPLPAWIGPDEMDKPQPGISPCTMVLRRATFDRVGTFDTHYQNGEDTDWFVRARQAGITFIMLQDVFLYRRVHNSNLMASRGPHFPLLARILKGCADRQRAGIGQAIRQP